MTHTAHEYILITGASHGIGRATALAFARAGYSILAVARNRDHSLEVLQQEIRQEMQQEIQQKIQPTTQGEILLENSPAEFLIQAGDVGDPGFIRNLFDFLGERGSLKALINNAGISQIGLLQDMSLDQWNRMFQTNVTSLFLTCRAAIPLFLQAGQGSIVNVSSVWGSVGASCEVAYSATKGAINSFTRALAKELAPSNIRVNAAAFGAIDTSMNSFLSPEERKDLEEEIPMGRYGSPWEAADLILDLALHHSYLTGQVVTMDGGWI